MSRFKRMKRKYKKAVQERKARVVQATCAKCGGTYTQEEAKATRPVPFMESVEETGIQCPHCGDWIHAFFMNAELRELKFRVDELEKAWLRDGTRQSEWRYAALKNRFAMTFKAVNQDLQSLTNARSPHELLAELQEKDE